MAEGPGCSGLVLAGLGVLVLGEGDSGLEKLETQPLDWYGTVSRRLEPEYPSCLARLASVMAYIVVGWPLKGLAASHVVQVDVLLHLERLQECCWDCCPLARVHQQQQQQYEPVACGTGDGLALVRTMEE